MRITWIATFILTCLQRLTGDRTHLNALEERNAALERDVQRFNERRRIEHEVGLRTWS